MTWISLTVLGLVVLANLAVLVWLLRRRWRLGAGFLALELLLLFYAFWVEPRMLLTTRHEVAVTDLVAPVRIVAIGDPQPTRLHWSPRRLRAAFETAQAENPDLVLWLGDYAYEPGWARKLGLLEALFVEPAEIAHEMGRLKAPMGAYAVLGNHDWWWDGSEMFRLLEQKSVTVLIDDAVRAEHPRSKAALWIVGLDDVSAPRVADIRGALAKTDDSAPTILLSHSPDVFPDVPDTVALTLAGHTHGGQIVLPVIGPLAVPIENRAYAYGLIEEDDRRLYVTSGIGAAIVPLRFGRPPEIVVIDLVPE
ncbi:MAG: metallophosphoesterase [Pseudomonadota bacterium]